MLASALVLVTLVTAFEVSAATVPRPRASSITANPFAAHAIVDVRSSRIIRVNPSPTPKLRRRGMRTVLATLSISPPSRVPVAAPATPQPTPSRARLHAPMAESADASSDGSPQAPPSHAQAPTAKMELPKLELTSLCISPI